MCLLLAMDPRVGELVVYDLVSSVTPPEGVAADLDLLERNCRVRACALDSSVRPVDSDVVEECFRGCDLVIACIGIASMWVSRLETNMMLAKGVVEACAKFCPEAVVGLVVNPLKSEINTVVPAMAKLYERAGLDPLKVVGISCLDVSRANKLVHMETGAPMQSLHVPVVGGFDGRTAVPLFSQDPVAAEIPEHRQKELVEELQGAGEAVLLKKQRKCGPTLTQAHACMHFATAVLSGLAGKKTDVSCFVKSSACEGLEFFASRATFGRKGIEAVHPIGELTPAEEERLAAAKELLQAEIAEGMKYGARYDVTKPDGGIMPLSPLRIGDGGGRDPSSSP